MARTKTNGHAASISESEDSDGTVALCAEQFTCKICAWGYRGISAVCTEVGDFYDGIDQL